MTESMAGLLVPVLGAAIVAYLTAIWAGRKEVTGRTKNALFDTYISLGESVSEFGDSIERIEDYGDIHRSPKARRTFKRDMDRAVFMLAMLSPNGSSNRLMDASNKLLMAVDAADYYKMGHAISPQEASTVNDARASLQFMCTELARQDLYGTFRADRARRLQRKVVRKLRRPTKEHPLGTEAKDA